MRRVVLPALPLLAAVACAAPAPAAPQGEDACLTTDPPPPAAPPQALRFGTTPEVAGSAGLMQGNAAPVHEEATARALARLRPARREPVLRPNRRARPRLSRCATVTVRYQAGRRTISTRRARAGRDCRFASRVTFADPRRFAGRRRLTVRARFAGTPALAPVTARARTVRVG